MLTSKEEACQSIRHLPVSVGQAMVPGWPAAGQLDTVYSVVLSFLAPLRVECQDARQVLLLLFPHFRYPGPITHSGSCLLFPGFQEAQPLDLSCRLLPGGADALLFCSEAPHGGAAGSGSPCLCLLEATAAYFWEDFSEPSSVLSAEFATSILCLAFTRDCAAILC